MNYEAEKHVSLINNRKSFLLFLFLITNKGPQLTYFRIDFLVEVKAIFFTIPYLKQIVIKRFFGNANFLSSSFQRLLNVISKLVVKACVKLSP